MPLECNGNDCSEELAVPGDRSVLWCVGARAEEKLWGADTEPPRPHPGQRRASEVRAGADEAARQW